MKNKIFFWVLGKKVKYLFDFRKNEIAIINLIYLFVAVFCSYILGNLFNNETVESFTMTTSTILYMLYGLITISKKDFRNRIINRFYPLSKIKQYIIDFFLSFFDYYFFLFLFSGIGLFFSIDNYSLINFIFFLIGLLNTHALLSIFMPFFNHNIYLFLIKIIVFLLNFFLWCIVVNYSEYWTVFLIFSFLINFLIGYLLFLYTYKNTSKQKEIEQTVIMFKKQKAFAYINSLYYCKISQSKMLGTFFWKFATCAAYLSIIEGKIAYDSFEFAIFSPFLFTPYFHFRYFANIWGINMYPWLTINGSPNYKKKLLSFFISHIVFFVIVDFLFISGLVFYFSIWESKIVILYLLSLMVFIPSSLICSILFPVKVSKKIFYNQEAASSTTLISFVLYFIFSFSFFTTIYFAITILILCFLFSYYFFINLYKKYGNYKYIMYNLFF